MGNISIEQQLQIANKQLAINEKELKKKNHDLTERLKEINCLYNIGSIIQKYNSIDEVVSNSVKEIPHGWHYPEITVARITFRGKSYKTENFQETKWYQRTDLLVDNLKQGVLEVFYLEERPILDEGPFLKEERILLNSIGTILASAVDRILKNEDLQKAYQKMLIMDDEEAIKVMLT